MNAQCARCSHDGEGRRQMQVTTVCKRQRLAEAYARQHLYKFFSVSLGRGWIGNRVDAEKAVEACAAPFQLKRAWVTLPKQWD